MSMRRISIYTSRVFFKHDVTDGKQPTDSKEDEDKWGYTGSIEMMKTGRCSTFLFYAYVALFTNTKGCS
jgi:hypothetical protein